MSSTYSSSLRAELIGSGDQAGAWGATTNGNLSNVFDVAIAGYQTVSVTSASQALTYLNGSTTTAALNQSVYAMLRFTTTTTAVFSVYAPPVSKQYIVWNNSGYAMTIYNSTVIGNTTAAGTGITIANGEKVQVWSDATNFYSTTPSGTVPISRGGTGQTTAVAGFNALSTNAVFIDGSSNVGIGTTSPATYSAYTKLSVLNGVALAVDATNGGVVVGASTSGTELTYLSMGRTYNLANAGEIALATTTAKSILFGTNATERMRIDSSGNVGIGTSSPTAIGASYTTVDIRGSSGGGISVGTTGTKAGDIYGNSSGITYDAKSATGHFFYTNGTERMRISSAGGFSIGTTADPGAGALYATGNITAYYSDDRLKTRLGNIENALDKVKTLTGFYYEANQTAQDLGYKPVREVGVSAQKVQEILPEVVAPAPIDEQYLTVRYEKLVPLLIEAIKELTDKVEKLEALTKE
jgi:hypothetical protein